MWWLVVVGLLTVGLVVFVGLRQHRHPVPPGRPHQKYGSADPDSRDWMANEGGGLG